MWPGRVSNPGPLTYQSGALPTALLGPTQNYERTYMFERAHFFIHKTLQTKIINITSADNTCKNIHCSTIVLNIAYTCTTRTPYKMD